jgi:hypothetical protein
MSEEKRRETEEEFIRIDLNQFPEERENRQVEQTKRENYETKVNHQLKEKRPGDNFVENIVLMKDKGSQTRSFQSGEEKPLPGEKG